MATLIQPSTETAGGADFIYRSVLDGRIFTPEDFTFEHRQFYATARDFAVNEVEPLAEDLDHKKPGVLKELMGKAAELGLFMEGIPEAYGGLGLDKVTSMLIAEALASVGSFAVTYGAHTGIGTLPLVYYGTEEQKQKYLPKLASGELMGAYCLSEPGSGSDALAAKTTAVLSEDGSHYTLNGTKAWITNGGIADLFTVFAQVVDGDSRKFTAFLVERSSAGLSIGNEERKLGIRGSSTTLLILDDVKVPAENLLGELGRGHKIAFNILNIGRWKLGVGCTGGSKHALGLGISYALERRQFKKPIATFGLIREKIADAAIGIYAAESMSYRTAGLIDAGNGAQEEGSNPVDVIEEFTIESSILKVVGSETLGTVADEMLQIHGGNGYTEDYPIERVVRDARINRIFEGTNEINRLIVPATMFKWALQGRIPIMAFMQQVQGELSAPETLPALGDGPLAQEVLATERVRRAIVYVASHAAQKYMADLKDKQRILGAIADSLANLFGMDSVVKRALQAVERDGEEKSSMHLCLAALYCFEARVQAFQQLYRVVTLMAADTDIDLMHRNLSALDQRYPADVMGLQETVVEHLLDAGGWSVAG